MGGRLLGHGRLIWINTVPLNWPNCEGCGSLKAMRENGMVHMKPLQFSLSKDSDSNRCAKPAG